MKRIQFFLIGLGLTLVGFSQSEYSSFSISSDLKKDAYAVMRNYNSTFEVNSKSEAKQTVKYAITILNEKGDSYAHFGETYDKFEKISNLKIIVYDKNGNKKRKIKSADIYDLSLLDGFSVYADNRVKTSKIIENDYPFTVEVSYTKTFTGILAYPLFIPQMSRHIAIEHSEMSVIVPKDISYRYKALNYNFKEIEVDLGAKIKKTWLVENYKSRDDEPYSLSFLEVNPVIYFSPNEFEFDESTGNLETWGEFGKWIYGLIEGRDVIPLETKNVLLKLTEGIDDPIQKAKIVYEYMQSKTRYVSIQMGIGGFQPFTAESVDVLGYGDCKALSNYTKALLEVVGIKSNYVIVGAGSETRPFFKDFTSINQFNHVILSVPIEKDTIWLECTSQDIPFGYIGTFTDDRNVILVNENGGFVAKTKKYEQKENSQVRKAEVVLDINGDIKTEMQTTYKGLQYNSVYHQSYGSHKEKKEALEKWIPLANFYDLQFDYLNNKDIMPELIQTMSFSSRSFASKSGDRLMFEPNIFNAEKYVPEKVDDRMNEVSLNFAYIDIDTVKFHYPEDYQIEFLPEDVEIVNEFGSYSIKLKEDKNEILYIRTVTKNEGIFPKEKYEDLRIFLKKMVKLDKSKVILKKNS